MNRLLPRAGLALLLLALGCQPPDAPPSLTAATPGPDTTFFQEASWSPDGSRLALSRLDIHDAYRASLATIRADGSGYTALTDGPGDMWTTWSPDGTEIAYASTKDDNRDIYRLPAEGGPATRLTTDPAEDTHPDWSPDGSRIVFVSKRTGQAQLFVIPADGSAPTRLTDSPEEKWNPRWSPDGRQLVYYGSREGDEDSVYVMNADGTGRHAVGAGIWPSWSPDGSKILYGVEDDLYEMNTDGTNPTLRLKDAVIARWSPDGTRLAVIRVTWRAPDGWPATADLFVVQAEGAETTQLTRQPPRIP